MNSMLLNTASAVALNKGAKTKQMKSNIARDILKRSNEFQSDVDAIFEYIANAYESYDLGSTPLVHIQIDRNQITISDNGGGMTEAKFDRMWCMHASTERREKGLNKRGYNGTGKIAGLRLCERIQVSTVKDGLRQTAYLDINEVRKAASEEREPELVFVEQNVPVTSRNGTTVTLSTALKETYPEGFDAQLKRDLHQKISKERMMWMFMGNVRINQVEVEKLELSSDAQHSVTSPCGSFTVEMFYLERGYEHELQDVHVLINGNIVGVEKYGKDGHRLANKVYVKADTTKEWADANFEHQRERFTSESRNLKMKTTVPAARDYKDFITASVADFMRKLDLEDAERRKAYLDEETRALEERIGGSLTSVHGSVRRAVRAGSGKPRGTYEKHEIVTRGERKPPRSQVSFRTEEFGNDSERYRVNKVSPNCIEIIANAKFAHMTSMSATGKKTFATEQAILETALAAYVEMEVENQVNEKFAEIMPKSTGEFLEFARKVRSDIELIAYRRVADQFEAFRKFSTPMNIQPNNGDASGTTVQQGA